MRFLIFDAGKPTAVRVRIDSINAYFVDPTDTTGKTTVVIGHEDMEISVVETPEEIDAAIVAAGGGEYPVRIAH